MRKNFLILFVCLFGTFQAIYAEGKESSDTVSVKSSALKYRGYSGGMMLHTGYVQSRPFDIISESGDVSKQQLKGAPFGIGGALRVHFGKHLRVGTEGYASTFSYGENDSYASIGWGGLLVDGVWTIDRWTVFAGGTVGGGSMKHVAMSDDAHNDYVVEGENAMFRKYSFAVVVPFVGAEYALTQKVHLIIKMDYMCNVSNWQDDFITGPRLYFGFMFCH